MVVEGAELLSVALDAGAPVESVYVAPEGRDNAAVRADPTVGPKTRLNIGECGLFAVKMGACHGALHG